MTRLESGRVDDLNGRPLSWLAGPLAWLGRPLIRLAHVRYLRQLGALLDVQAGPRPRPEFASIVKPSKWSWMMRWDSIFSAGLERGIESGDLFASKLTAAELGVALRRYRLEHGSYPDGLSALVPEYPAECPNRPVHRPPARLHAQRRGIRTARGGAERWQLPPPELDWIVAR